MIISVLNSRTYNPHVWHVEYYNTLLKLALNRGTSSRQLSTIVRFSTGRRGCQWRRLSSRPCCWHCTKRKQYPLKLLGNTACQLIPSLEHSLVRVPSWLKTRRDGSHW